MQSRLVREGREREARCLEPASVSTSDPSGNRTPPARLAGELDSRGLPVQPAGDHQMQDEPELVVEPDGDPLSQATDLADLLAEGGFQRRVEGSKQEGAAYSHVTERLTDDPPLERLNVDRDVR